jgi:hypothetical protein
MLWMSNGGTISSVHFDTDEVGPRSPIAYSDHGPPVVITLQQLQQ